MGTFYVIDDSHRLDQFIISNTRKGKHFQKKIVFSLLSISLKSKEKQSSNFFLLKPCNGKIIDIIMGYTLIGFEA